MRRVLVIFWFTASRGLLIKGLLAVGIVGAGEVQMPVDLLRSSHFCTSADDS